MGQDRAGQASGRWQALAPVSEALPDLDMLTTGAGEQAGSGSALQEVWAAGIRIWHQLYGGHPRAGCPDLLQRSVFLHPAALPHVWQQHKGPVW